MKTTSQDHKYIAFGQQEILQSYSQSFQCHHKFMTRLELSNKTDYTFKSKIEEKTCTFTSRKRSKQVPRWVVVYFDSKWPVKCLLTTEELKMQM